jgi:hypothetical protein
MVVGHPPLESQRCESPSYKINLKSGSSKSDIQRTSLKMLVAFTVPCLSFPRVSHHLTRLPIYIALVSQGHATRQEKITHAHLEGCAHSRNKVSVVQLEGGGWLQGLKTKPAPNLFYKGVACVEDEGMNKGQKNARRTRE